jgi:hypothetical protein
MIIAIMYRGRCIGRIGADWQAVEPVRVVRFRPSEQAVEDLRARAGEVGK